jgi:hypothetical protein
MDTQTGSTGVIVALVDEDGELEHVWRAGMEVVGSTPGTRLILYDASSASALTEPVASAVSADSVAEEYGPLLSPEDLDKLGRSEISRRVRLTRDQGIDGWGHLASDHGMEAVMEFACSQGADLVLLPEELGDPSILKSVAIRSEMPKRPCRCPSRSSHETETPADRGFAPQDRSGGNGLARDRDRSELLSAAFDEPQPTVWAAGDVGQNARSCRLAGPDEERPILTGVPSPALGACHDLGSGWPASPETPVSHPHEQTDGGRRPETQTPG